MLPANACGTRRSHFGLLLAFGSLGAIALVSALIGVFPNRTPQVTERLCARRCAPTPACHNRAVDGIEFMSWWKFGRRERESVDASWLGEKIAEMFDASSMLELVRKWHGLLSDDPRAFVAVASLRVAGFRIGSNQQSIVSRADPRAIAEVHHSFIGALIDKSIPHDSPSFRPYDRLADIMKLAGTLTDAFYANADSKPPLPIPHWFSGKEICMFLQSGNGAPNPEEVMRYADFLSESMRGTKKVLDELLDANVLIVQSQPKAV